MEENKQKKPTKLTYEQVVNALEQTRAYNQQLQKMVYEQNMTNLFKRLDYLFKVIDYESAFEVNHSDFVVNCINEIVEILTVSDEETAEEK